MIGLLLIFSAVMWQINPVKGDFSAKNDATHALFGEKKKKKEPPSH
jgi:hypothetical protein